MFFLKNIYCNYLKLINNNKNFNVVIDGEVHNYDYNDDYMIYRGDSIFLYIDQNKYTITENDYQIYYLYFIYIENNKHIEIKIKNYVIINKLFKKQICFNNNHSEIKIRITPSIIYGSFKQIYVIKQHCYYNGKTMAALKKVKDKTGFSFNYTYYNDKLSKKSCVDYFKKKFFKKFFYNGNQKLKLKNKKNRYKNKINFLKKIEPKNVEHDVNLKKKILHLIQNMKDLRSKYVNNKLIKIIINISLEHFMFGQLLKETGISNITQKSVMIKLREYIYNAYSYINYLNNNRNNRPFEILGKRK